MRRPHTMFIPIPNASTGVTLYGTRTTGGILMPYKTKIVGAFLHYHKEGTTSNTKLDICVYNGNSTAVRFLYGTSGARKSGSTCWPRITGTLTAAKVELSTTQRMTIRCVKTNGTIQKSTVMLKLNVMQ